MKVMRIKELREAANLKQTELAIQMGVLPTAVSNWENEVALPKARQLPLLARVLGVLIDELFVPIGDVSRSHTLSIPPRGGTYHAE